MTERELIAMIARDALAQVSPVAFEVGYEGASQFNRECKRFFGQSPMRDVQASRARL